LCNASAMDFGADFELQALTLKPLDLDAHRLRTASVMARGCEVS